MMVLVSFSCIRFGLRPYTYWIYNMYCVYDLSILSPNVSRIHIFQCVFPDKRVYLGQSIATVSAGGNFTSKLECVLWLTSWSFKASINPTSSTYMHPLLLELLVKYHSTNSIFSSVVNGCLVPGAHISACRGSPKSTDLADMGDVKPYTWFL